MKNKKILPLIIGIIIAILTILTPIGLLFIIPALIFLVGNKKTINNLTIFAIAFLVIYIPLTNFDETSFEQRIYQSYNSMKEGVIDTSLGEVKTIKGIKVIDSFDEDDGRYTLISNGENVDLEYTTEDLYEGLHSLKLTIEIPTENSIRLETLRSPTEIMQYVEPLDWQEHTFINIWLKTDGELGSFGIILIDEDGELWQYHDESILKKRDWSLLQIPIKDLKIYEQVSEGDGKLGKVEQYIFNFEPYSKKKDLSRVFIDKMYLSKI